MPAYSVPNNDDPLQIRMNSEALDRAILELKSALSPKVLFTHDLLELSKMAHDVKNWHIQAALDILQEYEHPF